MTTSSKDNKHQAEIDNILNEWPQWNIGLASQPTIAQELNGSSSNTSCILNCSFSSGTQQYLVLRIHKDNPIFQADRHQEYIIQQAVNAIGSAAAIVYQHPNGYYRLSEFIQGESFGSIFTETNTRYSTAEKTKLVKQLCLTVSHIHQLNLAIADFSYSNCIENYGRILLSHLESQLSAQALSKIQQRQIQMLALCQDYEKQYGTNNRVPCHIDLNANNILLTDANLLAASRNQVDGPIGDLIDNLAGNPINSQNDPKLNKPRIVILDWEFAGKGIASMDFAAIAIELQIDITELSIYSGITQKELDCARQIYQYTCDIYNQALALESA